MIKLKIDAKVMLVVNIDTECCLTNDQAGRFRQIKFV